MHGGSNRSESEGAATRPNISLAAKQWLTPNVPNGGRSVSAEMVASKGMTEDGEKRTVGLESQTKHWPTPSAFINTGTPEQFIARKQRTQATVGVITDLSVAATHWPTSVSLPQAQPIPDGLESSQSDPTSPQRLNPAFGCWLMGWPSWWTNPGITSSVKSETELWRCRLQSDLSSLFADQD